MIRLIVAEHYGNIQIRGGAVGVIRTVYDSRSNFTDTKYVAGTYDIQNPSIRYSYGNKGWRSLVGNKLSSAAIVDESHRTHRACRRRANSVVLDASDAQCFSHISSSAQRSLSKIAALGYTGQSVLFATSLRGARGLLPWFMNGKQLALSHYCPEEAGGECFSQDLARFKVHHQSSDPRQNQRGFRMTSASRLIETRSAITPARQRGTHEKQNRETVFRPLETMGLAFAAEEIGAEKVIVPHDNDWWSKIASNVRKLKEYIGRKHSAAARMIPSGSSAMDVESARQGACYTREEYAGRATEQKMFPSHRIRQGIELKSKSYQLWLFQPGCTNGAEARNSLWILIGERNANEKVSAHLRDVSFHLRYEVGDRPSGLNAGGTLQTHRELGNTLGFGSWPQSVDSTAIADDRYLVANGTWPGGRWALVFDLETQKVKTFIRNVENADDFGALALTKDGRTLVQANTNGQLFFYDTATGKVVLRGVETDDELIIYDDNGYYLASPEGGQFLHLKFPGIPGYSSVAQFASTLNRPDAIKAILAGKSALPRPALTAPPELRVATSVDGSGSARRATLNYETGSEVGLQELIVFVDGRPVQSTPLAGERQRGTVEISLEPEARWISAVTVDRSGYRSIARGRALPGHARPETSELFVIAAGNDTYDHLNQLGGTKTDAKSFVRLAEASKGRLYSDVSAVPLLDERDFRARLLAEVRSAAARAGANDTIMLFAAGHGLQGADGRFYLTAPATLPDQVEATSIAWQDIAAAFAGTKARVVVFLDACQSGAAATSSGTNDDAVAALLQNAVPITVIAASKGRQNSAETLDGAAGVFTNALFRAVVTNRKSTDADGNGTIELAELYSVVKREVVSVTRGFTPPHDQTPWLARNQMVGEVPLF